jgi:hypothetical protein
MPEMAFPTAIAYFLHYRGAGSQAAAERSKVRFMNQYGYWKRLPVKLDTGLKAVSGLGKVGRLRRRRLYFPHYDPPRSEPVYCGKDGRGPDQSTGNPTCPP